MDWFKVNELPPVPHLPTSRHLVDFYGFAIARQERFLARLNGTEIADKHHILDVWKFTNCYRILDRVSQYQLKNIIDCPEMFGNVQNYTAGIYLFRMFNSIETWERMPYKFDAFAHLYEINEWAEEQRLSGKVLYGNAYLMTAPWSFGYNTRTDLFIGTLQNMEERGDLHKAYTSTDMRTIYAAFRSSEGFGDFLAYQFALDFSYMSRNVDYEKFVVPGIGCQRGMRRVWSQLKYDYMPSILKRIAIDGIPAFPDLVVDGRTYRLRGSDIQSLFCEYDKYCLVRDENRRLKNKFNRHHVKLPAVYIPEAWRV